MSEKAYTFDTDVKDVENVLCINQDTHRCFVFMVIKQMQDRANKNSHWTSFNDTCFSNKYKLGRDLQHKFSLWEKSWALFLYFISVFMSNT